MDIEEAIRIVGCCIPKQGFKSTMPKSERIAFWSRVREGDIPYGKEKATQTVERLDSYEITRVEQAQEAFRVLCEAVREAA